MDVKPIENYIHFGVILWHLRNAQAEWPVHGCNQVLEAISNFMECVDAFDLPVTKRAARDLQQYGHKLEESNPSYVLTEDEAEKLAEIAKDLQKTLYAEAEGNLAFIVTDKRIDINKLLFDIPALMSPGTFNSLPYIACYDFIEAGLCIAFDRSTAAAFHLLRGTEAVLRDFYLSIVKRNRVKLLWGPMVDQLKRRKNPPPMPLLDNLDNIRRSFRNPTQHPEKIYDIEEVQDLFSLCIDVVNRMATFITPSIRDEEQIDVALS